MAKYRAITKSFISGQLIEEGQIFTINDEFQPGVHLEPMDEAAEAAMEKYLETRKRLNQPDPNVHPIDALPDTISSIGDAPEAEADLSLSMAEQQGAQAKPGPTDGGKVQKQG